MNYTRERRDAVIRSTTYSYEWESLACKLADDLDELEAKYEQLRGELMAFKRDTAISESVGSKNLHDGITNPEDCGTCDPCQARARMKEEV